MNLKSVIESVLFLHGEPVTVQRLAKLAGGKPAQVHAALEELRDEYRERGIVLIQNGEEWQLATNPANKAVIEKLARSEFADDLSKAGLEVLAIVAYKGPISRTSIDYLRGVDSSYSLRNLLLRGLVSREENTKDRRSYLYRIATEFLKHLGLARLEDLAHYKELKKQEVEVQKID